MFKTSDVDRKPLLYMHKIKQLLAIIAFATFPLATNGALKDSIKLSLDPPSIALGNKFKLQLNGYAQAHYELTSIDKKVDNDFQVKRVMLIGNAMVGKRLRAMVMVDLASRRSDRFLHEYFMEYSFMPELKVRVGQFKQPFMLENIYIPTILGALNMTEGTRYMAGIAGDPLQGNMVGRDLGIMVSGEALPMKDGHRLMAYSLGVFNGAGLNQRDNNKAKDVIGMLQIYPTKNLQLTTSCIIGRGHAVEDSPYGDILQGENYKRLRWSAGIEWKEGPLYLRSEYTRGRNGNIRSQAFYAESSVRTFKNFDVVANYDFLDRNIGLPHDVRHSMARATKSHNYTLGFQYWIWRQCRVATQYVHTRNDNGKNSHQWLTQFQFSF